MDLDEESSSQGRDSSQADNGVARIPGRLELDDWEKKAVSKSDSLPCSGRRLTVAHIPAEMAHSVPGVEPEGQPNEGLCRDLGPLWEASKEGDD